MKKSFAAALALGLAMALSIVGVSGTVFAAKCPDGSSQKEYTNSIAECSLPTNPDGTPKDFQSSVNNIINVVIGMVGLVAIIVMIIGGIFFLISQGDSAKITRARNTILYGVVGLIISLLAFAIVNFVIGAVNDTKKGAKTSGSGGVMISAPFVE